MKYDFIFSNVIILLGIIICYIFDFISDLDKAKKAKKQDDKKEKYSMYIQKSKIDKKRYISWSIILILFIVISVNGL